MLGRTGEFGALADLVEDTVAGRGRVVRVVGANGAGKTTLLDQVERLAGDRARVVRFTAVESERDLAFSGLQALSRPLLPALPRLPVPQAEALEVALAMRAGPPPAPLAVGAATLNLFAANADLGPLLVLIDDAHLLDEVTADALAFAARRLGNDQVSLVFAVDPDVPASAIAGVAAPDVVLGPLPQAVMGELLHRTATTPVAEEVVERIVAAAQGAPGTVLAIAGALTADQLAGRRPLPSPLPVAGAPAFFARRLRTATRVALAVVAASRTGAANVIAAALGAIDVPRSALEPALRAGVIRLEGTTYRFTSTAARSAAYEGVSPNVKQAVHRTLAETVGGEQSPDHRAWHLARAASAPDESIARVLEARAEAARGRGAPGLASELFEQASALSPESPARGRRAFHAAETAVAAGVPEVARAHLERILPTLSGQLQVDTTALLGRVMIDDGRVREGVQLLLEAARLAGESDPRRASSITSAAAVACAMSRRPAEAIELGRRAVRLAGDDRIATAMAAIALGTAQIVHGDAVEGRAVLLGGIAPGVDGATELRQLLDSAAMALIWVEAYDEARALLEALERDARSAGAAGLLVRPLSSMALLEYRQSRVVPAYAAAAEAVRLSEGVRGQNAIRASALVVLALCEGFLGRADDGRLHVEEALATVAHGRGGLVRVGARAALGFLELSSGDAPAAVAAFEPLSRARDSATNPATAMWEVDNIEALCLVGRKEEARALLADFERRAAASGSNRSLGATARAHGILAADHDFDRHFVDSLEEYAQIDQRFGAARTRLWWGRRLLGAGRCEAAVEQLRGALTVFEEIWTTPWAEQATRDLARAGVDAPPRAANPVARLTSDVFQVAAAAPTHRTVPQIARALFLPPRVVEDHLAEAIAELGVGTVDDLVRVLQPAWQDHVELRRTTPEERTIRGESYDVQLLGRFRVMQAGVDATPPPGLAATAVKLVAMRPGTEAHIEEIIDALWPDLEVFEGRARLRSLLARLRRTTGELVRRDGDLLRLAPGTTVDLHRFEREVDAALREPDVRVAIRTGNEALALYRGDLLPGALYETWAAAPRRRAQRRLLALLDHLSLAHEHEGRLDDAVALAERALSVEHPDAARYERVFELHLRRGRRSEAAAVLEQAREAHDDLGLPLPHSLVVAEAQLRSSHAS